jgi:hypothetical protein
VSTESIGGVLPASPGPSVAVLTTVEIFRRPSPGATSEYHTSESMGAQETEPGDLVLPSLVPAVCPSPSGHAPTQLSFGTP